MQPTLYKAVICFSIYSAAQQYYSVFLEALLKLENTDSVALLILKDGYCFSDADFNRLRQKFDVYTFVNNPDNTVQQTKLLLIEQAKCFNADVIIFTDSDDYLHPEVLHLYFGVLREHGFAYSDQILTDDNGQLLGKNLFDGVKVPRCMDNYKALLYQNYCGLSALAFNKETLDRINTRSMAANSIAPDWMLAMLALMSGSTAGQTQKPVVYYRQHQTNYFQAGKQLELYYEQKLLSLIVHLKSLDLPETREYLVDCRNALKVLHSGINIKHLLEPDNGATRFPWFQDIYRFVQSSKGIFN